MKTRLLLGSVLLAWVLAACGGDKPPMVPDPDTSAAPADAGAD
ncbi:MAG TPA: hypothetical protein VGH28_04395 [Polyangiaceae bacterium]|jgi:hypothetical protein